MLSMASQGNDVLMAPSIIWLKSLLPFFTVIITTVIVTDIGITVKTTLGNGLQRNLLLSYLVFFCVHLQRGKRWIPYEEI